MVDLYLLESPLQIRSAITSLDSACFSNSERKIFICRLNGEVKNDEQMLEAISELSGKVIVKKIKPNKKVKLFYLFIYSYILSFYFRVDNIFLGDYRSAWMKCCKFLPFNFNLYYLDDGLATIKLLVNFQSIVEEYAQVITSLPLPDHLKNNKRIFKVCSNKKNVFFMDSVYFIGSPLIEKNIISKSDLIKFIIKIKNDFPTMDITYVPHRSESGYILKDLFTEFNWNVLNTQLPFEDFYEILDRKPRFIVSFYSTVLVNLVNNYNGLNIYSYKIPSDSICESYRHDVKTVYSYLSELEGIEIRDC